jgi:hypothetical protein
VVDFQNGLPAEELNYPVIPGRALLGREPGIQRLLIEIPGSREDARPEMTFSPIAVEIAPARVIAAAATPSIDTEHAPNAADSRSHARPYRATDHRADRTRRASALAYTFPAALLRAAENALGVAGVRNGKQRENRCRHRKINPDAAMVWQIRCLRLHLNSPAP